MNSLEIKIDNQSGKLNVEIQQEGFFRNRVIPNKPKNLEYIFYSLHKNNKFNERSISPEFFLKEHNGVIIAISKDYLKVYVDKLRTVPLYIYKKNNEAMIFSDFNSFYKSSFDREIDIVGFWENLVFENPLGERTLFKYVKQFTFASAAVFDKNLDYRFEKYWVFSLPKVNVKSESEAVEGLNDKLSQVFSSFDPSSKYLTAISGGVDSRLILALMSRFIPSDNIALMTFGYDERIREYQYAKEVTETFGYEKPVFHKLTPDSYTRCLKSLIRKSGGTIGIQHCHTYDFLHSNCIESDYMISAVYTDALFGYAVNLKTKFDSNGALEDTSQYNEVNKLCEKYCVGDEIVKKIIEDLRKIYDLWFGNSTIDSFEEFFYYFERNVKFHINYTYILADNIKLVCPFFDLRILEYLFSLPAKYRYQKRIINLFFDKYFPELNTIGNISSVSKFQKPQKGNITLDFVRFKILNRVNILLSILTGDEVQFLNKYITENHGVNIRLHHRELLIESVKKLQLFGLLNKQQFELLKSKPYRPNSVNLQYQIISTQQAI